MATDHPFGNKGSVLKKVPMFQEYATVMHIKAILQFHGIYDCIANLCMVYIVAARTLHDSLESPLKLAMSILCHKASFRTGGRPAFILNAAWEQAIIIVISTSVTQIGTSGPLWVIYVQFLSIFKMVWCNKIAAHSSSNLLSFL